ncbi:MAG: TIR domain-containing protein [Spiroplasma sp.]
MKKAFFSFYYDDDSWRAQMIRNMGKVTGNDILEPNDWEQVKRNGKQAIENWIKKQINASDVVIVLIGTNTYKREWVLYEIQYALENNKKVIGIHIHNLKDSNGQTAVKGQNPIQLVNHYMKNYATILDPSSYNTYKEIEEKLKWI